MTGNKHHNPLAEAKEPMGETSNFWSSPIDKKQNKKNQQPLYCETGEIFVQEIHPQLNTVQISTRCVWGHVGWEQGVHGRLSVQCV